jgi:hypothetical protein
VEIKSSKPPFPVHVPADITQLPDLRYGEPDHGTFATGDAVLHGTLDGKHVWMIFQMTVGKSHDVKIKGLVDIIAGCRITIKEKVMLFFVVIPETFDTFKVATFQQPPEPKEKGKGGKGAKPKPMPIPTCVEYWVLELMPLAEWKQANKMKRKVRRDATAEHMLRCSLMFRTDTAVLCSACALLILLLLCPAVVSSILTTEAAKAQETEAG